MRIGTVLDTTGHKRRAEGLLYELAGELKFLPLEERTRDLHLRALSLKRTIGQWSDDEREAPDGAERESVCAEIVSMQERAREFRGRIRSGQQLVAASRAGSGWRSHGEVLANEVVGERVHAPGRDDGAAVHEKEALPDSTRER
jgi:hypothetical protein